VFLHGLAHLKKLDPPKRENDRNPGEKRENDKDDFLHD
jgi:hypothetical protein